MNLPRILVLSLLTATSVAQSENLFSSLLSDAQSIYTIVTSVLAPASATNSASTTSSASASSASTAATDSSSVTSSESLSTPASTSLSSSSTSTPFTPSSPSVTAPPSSTIAAAAQPSISAGAANNQGDGGAGGSNTLAIVLGCTLGSLALAAFLALLFLYRRHKRRSGSAAKQSLLSPVDNETESWRHEKPRVRPFKSPDHHAAPISATNAEAPLMRVHQYDHTGQYRHQNPFVPVPPPARRSSRSGINDTVYSPHPYSPDQVNGYDTYPPCSTNCTGNHADQALAAGLGGAALGGLAAHARQRRERNRSASEAKYANDPAFSEDELNALPQVTSPGHRSGSVGRANAKEPWPFMNAHGRHSVEGMSFRKRSMSRSQEQFMTPDQHPSDHQDMPSDTGLLAAAGTGGLATAAAAAHHRNNPSAHQKGIMKHTTSNTSDPSSLSCDQGTSNTLSDVAAPAAHNSGPHELASADVPTTPVTRGRPHSALGMAAPLAAAGAVDATGRRRSGSASRRSPMNSPATQTYGVPLEHGSRPPFTPSRSPKRTSLDSRAPYSVNEGTANLPVSSLEQAHPGYDAITVPLQDAVSPPFEAAREQDGVVSPVSPITSSYPGTLSKTIAEESGMSQATAGAKGSSQESTVVDSQSLKQDSSENSEPQSSGLVSAIQRIFNSQKIAWADEESSELRKLQEHISDDDEDEPRFVTSPRRKPASASSLLPHQSHHGEFGNPYTLEQTPQNTEPPNQTSPIPDRPSRESTRSLPPRYRSRTNSANNATATTDFAPVPSQTPTASTNRPRPGYGQGSGDPFDLARVRTDSNMTGMSLSNYQEPARPRPSPFRPFSGSDEYREPTLAELRHRVQEEDRQRARQDWMQRHRRSGSSGLRYGDDRDLFNLLDQTTGWDDYGDDSNRYYAKPMSRRTSRDVGMAM